MYSAPPVQAVQSLGSFWGVGLFLLGSFLGGCLLQAPPEPDPWGPLPTCEVKGDDQDPWGPLPTSERP